MNECPNICLVATVEHGDDEDMYITNVGGETMTRDQTKTALLDPYPDTYRKLPFCVQTIQY